MVAESGKVQMECSINAQTEDKFQNRSVESGLGLTDDFEKPKKLWKFGFVLL